MKLLSLEVRLIGIAPQHGKYVGCHTNRETLTGM